MGRSSRNSNSSNNNNNHHHQKGGTKQKSKAKAPKNSTRNTNGTKSRFPKRSKYSVHNNDVVVYRPIHPPSGSGKPTNYIYGAGAGTGAGAGAGAAGRNSKARKPKPKPTKQPAFRFSTSARLNNATATASSAFHHRNHRNHHNGRINNNNFSARKRGKRPFLLRLPVVGPRTPKTVQVPWLRGKDIQNQVLATKTSTRTNTKQSRKQQQQQQQQKQQQQQQQPKQQSLKPILNGTFSVHESTMDFFRSELEFFSEYVRLSRSEIKAREHLIDRIKRCCKSLFGVNDSDCQVFGSFAAQARSVCVFESDIDLAIWGVVEPDHEPELELGVGSYNNNNNNDDDNNYDNNNGTRDNHNGARAAAEQKPPGGPAAEDEQTEKNRRKQERIRKWKALIDDAAKNNNYVDLLSEREDTNNNNNNDNNNNNNDSPSSSSGEIGAATSNSFAALAENNKIQGKGRAEGEGKTGGSPLFVLDRVGDASLAPPEENEIEIENKNKIENENGGDCNGPVENITVKASITDGVPNEDGSNDKSRVDGVIDVDAESDHDSIIDVDDDDDDNDDDDDDDNDNDNDDDDDDNDDDDDDNADKLENYWSRPGNRNGNNNGTDTEHRAKNSENPGKAAAKTCDHDGNDDDDDESSCNNNNNNSNSNDDDDAEPGHDDEEEMLHGFGGIRRRPRGQSLVSLSSSTTCSVEAVAKLDESEMEVSFVVNGGASTSASASASASRKQTTDRDKVVGPTGRTRTLVVRSLFRLTKPLRSFSRQIHVRSKARVPIINMITNYGFECDIALGGHNGTDTSSYASTQLSRFKSFSTLVVFLKVLLSQQGLDKPFTGGLGSYALYVMVASHIEQHLELGGEDTPEEVLYTFLFRYGGVPPSHSNHRIDRSLLTPLSQESVIYTSDGGSIDMKPCFQIDNCILVFRECWRILDKKLSRTSDGKFSIVQFLIDAGKLELGRILTKQQADSGAPTGPGTSSSHFRFPERSNSNGNGAMTMAMTMTTFLRDEKKGADSDDEARELIRGYGQNVESFLPVTTATATATAAAAAATESSKRVTATNKKTNKKKRQKTTASYV